MYAVYLGVAGLRHDERTETAILATWRDGEMYFCRREIRALSAALRRGQLDEGVLAARAALGAGWRAACDSECVRPPDGPAVLIFDDERLLPPLPAKVD